MYVGLQRLHIKENEMISLGGMRVKQLIHTNPLQL